MTEIIRIPAGFIALILVAIMILVSIIGFTMYNIVRLVLEYKINKRKGK